jgi:hypothetical protein
MDHAAEDDLRDHDHDHSSHRVQRRIRHPENADQPDMFANPAAPKLDESKHSFAAPSAAWLSRLQRRTTLIAIHRFSSTLHVCPVGDTDASSSQFPVLNSQLDS